MFDDVSTPGGSRFESRLGDLASRHPELADHFYEFPVSRKFGTIPREHRKTEEQNSSQQSHPRTEANIHPETTTIGTQTGSLESDTKLRNTVPDMQTSTGELGNDTDRGQRSQSAPPQTTNKLQKEEGVRLIPIRTDSPSSGVPHPASQIPRPPVQNFQQQHPHFPSSQQQYFQQSVPQQQCTNDRHHEESKGPTVRHIPIYVEGRDEPILPKDAGSASTTKRGGCQGKTESAPPKRGPPEEKKETHHQQPSHEAHQHAPPPSQQQPTHTPPPPPPKPDPLSLVADIMKDVESLSARVSEWNGNSRTEKEYIYLDEMLTRNLLKLDNIETEGRDEVRTARREAIKRIQAAISVLESKAAATDDSNTAVAVVQNEEMCNPSEQTASEEKKCEPMEIDCSAPAEVSQEAGNVQQPSQT